MANDRKTGIDRLEEEMEKQTLETSKEELLEDARSAGRDPAAFAERMRAFVSEAKETAGKARLADARARLEQERQAAEGKVVRMPTPARAQERQAYKPDTMAARQGKKLSERDKKAMEEDVIELFDDGAWGKDKNDEDR